MAWPHCVGDPWRHYVWNSWRPYVLDPWRHFVWAPDLLIYGTPDLILLVYFQGDEELEGPDQDAGKVSLLFPANIK